MTEEPQPCFHLDKAYVMSAAERQPFFGRHSRSGRETGISAWLQVPLTTRLGTRFEAEPPGAGGKAAQLRAPPAPPGGGTAPPGGRCP